MRLDLITIGLPVYNAERFLKDSIQSILNQTYKDFILLIIDDGSNDSSVEIIKSFKDSRIIFIQDGQNKGLPYRLNQIARLTNTKYLARIDSDDIMHYARIEEQLKVLESNPEIDVLGSNAYSINEKNIIIGIRYKLQCNSSTKFFQTNSFIHPTIIGKTDWFQNNPYNIKALRIEDGELWFRTRKYSNFYVLNLPLLYYRESGLDYYKKYEGGIKSMWIIAASLVENRKIIQSIIWSFIALKYFSKYVVYYCLNIINKESYLINNRSYKLSQKMYNKACFDIKKSISDKAFI